MATTNLSEAQQHDFRAVTLALNSLKKYKNADLRYRLVDLCYWQSNLTVNGAAAVLHIAPITAHGWDREFISLVDAYLSL